MRIAFRNWLKKWSKRDRLLFCTPIALSLLLLGLFVENGGVMASAWRDPLTVLSERSPGARGAGALYSTKPKSEHVRTALAGVPTERVLGLPRVRPELPGILPPEATPLALGPDAIPMAAGLLPSSLTDGPGVQPFPDFFPPSPSLGGPIIVTPGLEPEVPVTPNPPPTPPGPPPPSPVPEPTTWLLNILGVFAIGGVMRYRRWKQAETLLAARQ